MEDVLFFLLVIGILQLTQKDSQRLPDAGLMQVRLTQQPVMPRVAQAVHNRFLFWHAAYSAITGILGEYNYFRNASISPFADSGCSDVRRWHSRQAPAALRHHITFYAPDVTSAHDYDQAVAGKSGILTVNTHTDRLITPFAVMYAHMFPHTSMETHKSHTYCQIPGYLTLTLSGNSSVGHVDRWAQGKQCTNL